ncbi:methyl-accepting chemotaxis protein [Paenibacillus nasutitermitis]|uniref:Methyl-accepting chemotaxis protein n=1 Tax=Paenibacillus nasutitermitis TaxID=1652958 RepID=A0A916YNN7_9BACL|nr:methyl-accepting chemotaxis protein [Paenibacillus nasutitermitis]GGD52657.1 hypothetical protein GCM10010911_07780 [Paenibacillus nasutitermitis]
MTMTYVEALEEPQVVSKSHQVKDQEWLDFIRPAPVVYASHTCQEVIQQFGSEPDCDCVVVCDDANKPRGLVMKRNLTIIQTHRFGRELYYSRSIVKLMDAHPIVIDEHTPPQKLLDLALGRNEKTLYDSVIVTSEERLIGILSVADLLHLSRLMQRLSIESQLRTIHGAESMIRGIDQAVVHVRSASEQGETMSRVMVDLTLQGKKELDKITAAFRSLSENTTKQEEQISELQQRASSISSVSRLIRDLAEQCNLLAVNATIEAARAGEHGRGFAVVANEVRLLANQTKQSADQIHALIRSILESVQQSVALVGEGRAEAASSKANVQAAFDAFEQLFQAAANNSRSAKEIGSLSKKANTQSEYVMCEMKRLVNEIQLDQ